MPEADGDDIDALLTAQLAYYRARAPEYDDWWRRVGDHDLGPVFAASWRANTDELLDALDCFAPTGEVLELAAGTGVSPRRSCVALHASSPSTPRRRCSP